MLFIFDDTTDVKPNYQKIASEIKEMEKVAFFPLAIPLAQMAGGYALGKGLEYIAPSIEKYTGIPQGVTNAASWLPMVLGGGAGVINLGRLGAQAMGGLGRVGAQAIGRATSSAGSALGRGAARASQNPIMNFRNSPLNNAYRNMQASYLKSLRKYRTMGRGDQIARSNRQAMKNWKNQQPAGTKVNQTGNPISGQGISVGNPNAAAGSSGMNIAGGGGLNVGNAGVFGVGAAQAASQAAPAPAPAGGGNMSNLLMMGMMAPSFMGGGQTPAPQQYGGFQQNMGVAPMPGMTGQTMPSPYHASRNQMPKIRYPDRGLF